MLEKEIEKEKMVRYLYPTKQIGEFMCNDLYQELLELISVDKCISEDNNLDRVRENNLSEVRGIISGFILGNPTYHQILIEYYKHDNINWIVRDVLIGLVLYISSIIKEFDKIDILKDPRSILYGECFMLDLLG